MAETLPGFRIDGGGFAVCAPAHTPPEVVRRFNVAIAGVLKDADFSGKMLALGQVTASGASAENAALYLKGERDRWEKIFRELAIEPQ
jgi:tripartite-type tricarboxylate transporter receptor subunit TctC